MQRPLYRLLLGRIPLISSPRVQLYGTLLLFGYGIWTTLHMPQGFDDYLLRCVSTATAFVLSVHVMFDRSGLTFIEKCLCSVLLTLLTILAPIFIWDAMQVRAFCNR
jgi:hypothetical protein